MVLDEIYFVPGIGASNNFGTRNHLRSENMSPISIETFGLVLILAYVLMCAVFILSQKEGKNFVDSFDKAFLWGCCLFIIGYGLDTVTYVTMA